jgi:hypothetical protein
MRPEDRTRILHMIEAAETVGDFVAGRVRDDLDSNRMLLFALVRAVEVLGEAAAKVSPETRAATDDMILSPVARTIAVPRRVETQLDVYTAAPYMHPCIRSSKHRHLLQTAVMPVCRETMCPRLFGQSRRNRAGDLIPGTGGARKRRFAGRGKGKSGGYRTVSYLRATMCRCCYSP